MRTAYTTVSPSILASAVTKFSSAPAMVNHLSVAAFGDQAAAEMGKFQADLVALHFHGFIPRAGVFDVAAIDIGQRDAGQAVADILFVFWMDIFWFADVGGDGHAGVGQGQNGGLGLAD